MVVQCSVKSVARRLKKCMAEWRCQAGFWPEQGFESGNGADTSAGKRLMIKLINRRLHRDAVMIQKFEVTPSRHVTRLSILVEVTFIPAERPRRAGSLPLAGATVVWNTRLTWMCSPTSFCRKTRWPSASSSTSSPERWLYPSGTNQSHE
jgi:hypothetical protein